MRRVTLLTVAVTLVGCGTVGSGDAVTERRTVDSFDSLDISAGINVELVVEPGAAQSVEVFFDDNLLDKVVTEIRGDTLVVQFDGSVSIFGSGRYVSVVAGELIDIEVSGGADLTGSGEADSYVLRASGGADVDLADLVAESVEVDASGGSDVRIYASESVEGEASGGSNVRIYGDPARSRVDTSGGADVDYEN